LKNQIKEYDIFESLLITNDNILCYPNNQNINIKIAYNFVKNFFSSLEYDDDIINYYTLIDSDITKDVFNKDSFIFNTEYSVDDVKKHLDKCIFRNIAFYKYNSNSDFSQNGNKFFQNFNENYYETYSDTKIDPDEDHENTREEYAFQFQAVIEDILYVNFDIFGKLSLDIYKNMDLSLLRNREIIEEQILTFKMILIYLHEIAHNKIFHYAISNDKNKNNFNTPFIKKLSNRDNKHESGVMLENLIAVIHI